MPSFPAKRIRLAKATSKLGLALCMILTCGCNSGRRLDLTIDGLEGRPASVYEDGTHIDGGSRAPRATGNPIEPQIVELNPGYYGKTKIDVEGPVDAFVSDRTRASTLVDVPEPAPSWLFPFDFAIEAVRRTILGYHAEPVTLHLEPPAAPIAGGGTTDDPGTPTRDATMAIEAARRSQIAR
ncbi:MAG: hypothetical protein KDC95_22430 [Planctomycetes bacterium]|nr:hypothetical protein [Planctomycetota bacterium]